jgi:hypothetical protein
MDEATVYKVLRRMVTAGHLTDAFRHHREKEGLWYVGDHAPAVSWDYALGYATAAKALLDA